MRIQRPFALLLVPLLLLLTACGGFSVPFEPDVEGVIVASTTVPGTRVPLTLVPGESVWYEVVVPAGSSALNLLYVEIEGTPGVTVALHNARGVSLGAANDPRYFVRNRAALVSTALSTTGADGTLAPMIAPEFTCVGPCVAARATVASYFVEVRNPLASLAIVDLFAYRVGETDPNEPNDFWSGATPLSGATSIDGYLERIGDVDWFRYTGSSPRTVRLESSTIATRLGLRLEILAGPSAAPGAGISIFPGEYFAVYSSSNRAAAARDSKYTVTIGAVVAGAGTIAVEPREDPTGISRVLSGYATEVFLLAVDQPNDLLYVEAVGGLGSDVEVRLLTRGGELLGVSRSPSFFASSVGLLVANEGLLAPVEGASIGPYRSCRGPCVAVQGGTGVYLLEVENRSWSSALVNLSGRTVSAQDANDRGSSHNDSLLRATPLLPGSNHFGAIERLGDYDYYRYDDSVQRSLIFTAFDPSLGLEICRIQGFGCFPVSGPIQLRAGDRLRVYSSVGRAGPANTSGYFLQVSH